MADSSEQTRTEQNRENARAYVGLTEVSPKYRIISNIIYLYRYYLRYGSFHLMFWRVGIRIGIDIQHLSIYSCFAYYIYLVYWKTANHAIPVACSLDGL